MSPSTAGELYIKLVGAALTRDTELVGNMDPFAVITYNGKEYKTKTLNDAGKNPNWYQSFDIEVLSLNDDIKIACFDEDYLSNKLIGEHTFKVRAICQTTLAPRVIPLIF